MLQKIQSPLVSFFVFQRFSQCVMALIKMAEIGNSDPWSVFTTFFPIFPQVVYYHESINVIDISDNSTAVALPFALA